MFTAAWRLNLTGAAAWQHVGNWTVNLMTHFRTTGHCWDFKTEGKKKCRLFSCKQMSKKKAHFIRCTSGGQTGSLLQCLKWYKIIFSFIKTKCILFGVSFQSWNLKSWKSRGGTVRCRGREQPAWINHSWKVKHTQLLPEWSLMTGFGGVGRGYELQKEGQILHLITPTTPPPSPLFLTPH